MDAPLSLDLMTMEEEQPIIALIALGLLMAIALIFPAAVDAARRGCLAVWRMFAASGPASPGEGPESIRAPGNSGPPSEGPWRARA